MFNVRLLSSTLVLTLTLVSCGQAAELAPEEVIRRAVIRSNTVESVAVSLSANIRTEQTTALSGSLVVQAVIRSGGQAWSADTSFHVNSITRRGHERASGRMVAVSPGTGLMYLRLESAEGILGQMLRRSFTGSTNGWMVYGEDSGAKLSERHTPDPAVMSSYADALSVTENLGIVKDNGRSFYHYRVALKPEMLSAMPQGGTPETNEHLKAEGEMWIDTRDFSLSRVIWNVSGVPSALGAIVVHADALFSEYDSAAQIQSPVGTAATLPLESIFAIFSS